MHSRADAKMNVLGFSWPSLGCSSGCSWGSLGGFSGAKEPSWAPLGCSWGPLGGLLRSSGLIWGVFGRFLGSHVGLSRFLGIVFGGLGSLLGAMLTLCRTTWNSTTGFAELRQLMFAFFFFFFLSSWRASIPLGARRVSRSAGLNKVRRLLRQHFTRLCARRGRAVFHRFAHSAGPGVVRQ